MLLTIEGMVKSALGGMVLTSALSFETVSRVEPVPCDAFVEVLYVASLQIYMSPDGDKGVPRVHDHRDGEEVLVGVALVDVDVACLHDLGDRAGDKLGALGRALRAALYRGAHQGSPLWTGQGGRLWRHRGSAVCPEEAKRRSGTRATTTGQALLATKRSRFFSAYPYRGHLVAFLSVQ